MELLRAPCAAPAPLAADARDDWRGAALADALASFNRTHGALLGTRPFLRGWRAWLEAQRGLESPLVFRLRPEALTQSGGPAWARDAVALLRAHAVRRPQLELEGQQSELPEWCVCAAAKRTRAPGSPFRRRRLVWALPDGFGDDDVRTALGALPPDAALDDVNATGELAADTSPAATQRSRVLPRGGKATRLCCCFGPAMPFM